MRRKKVDPLIGSAATASPGDTLIVGFDRAISDDEYEEFQSRFRPLIDQGVKVFLVEHCTSLAVVKGANLGQPPE